MQTRSRTNEMRGTFRSGETMPNHFVATYFEQKRRAGDGEEGILKCFYRITRFHMDCDASVRCCCIISSNIIHPSSRSKFNKKSSNSRSSGHCDAPDRRPGAGRPTRAATATHHPPPTCSAKQLQQSPSASRRSHSSQLHMY